MLNMCKMGWKPPYVSHEDPSLEHFRWCEMLQSKDVRYEQNGERFNT